MYRLDLPPSLLTFRHISSVCSRFVLVDETRLYTPRCIYAAGVRRVFRAGNMCGAGVGGGHHGTAGMDAGRDGAARFLKYRKKAQ